MIDLHVHTKTYAKKHRLIITGGSDFHGFYGEIPVELGCRELGKECIDELISRKEKVLKSLILKNSGCKQYEY